MSTIDSKSYTEVYSEPHNPRAAEVARHVGGTAAANEMLGAPERGLSDEVLAQLSAEAAVAVSVWAYGRGVPEEYGGVGGAQFQSLYNRRFAQELLAYKTNEDLMADYASAGVSELVTIEQIRLPFRKVNPSSTRGDEPTTVLSFETTANTKVRTFVYQEGNGRPGNRMVMHVALPKSQAKRFLQAIEADWLNSEQSNGQGLDTIHRFMNQQMTGTGPGQFSMDAESWKKFGPPVDAWREANGGIRRVAIRRDLNESPEASQILEF